MKISKSFQCPFLYVWLCVWLFLGGSLPASASIAKSVKNPDFQWLVREGAVRGGTADDYMSLLDVRPSVSRLAKTQRLIIDWGNKILQPSTRGGYYQVEYHPPVKSVPARVIVNMGLTLNSRIQPKAFTEKFKQSVYVKQARLEFDPISQSESLIFELRKPMRVRVSSYPGRTVGKVSSPAHLVVDLVE